ncbi:MAG: GlxA family transcriptional regulator [Nocardioidaceae bacterium]
MADRKADAAGRRVLVVAYDGAELLDIGCVTSTLLGANRVSGRSLYRMELLAPGGRPVTCDSGLTLRADGSLQRAVGPADTLVVSGGYGHEAAGANRSVVAHVRRLAGVSRRVASVCTGASVLAAAGLLDGRRATTHWLFADELARRYPTVQVDPDPIYVRDGDVYTSAGVTSALDLTLAFVQEDHGERLARQIARGLVTFLHRPGNQAQVSMYIAADPPDHRVVRNAVDFVTANVAEPLDAARHADHVGVSGRQLNRLFLEHLGVTPGRFVRRTRTEAAARLLSSTSLPVSDVAKECGFGTAEALRQAFVRHYEISPSRYRLAHAGLRAG